MKEVYILTVVKEIEEERPEVSVWVYGSMTAALNAYKSSVDEARADSEEYERPCENREIATENRRYFRIEDLQYKNSISISVEPREIIGEEPDESDGFDMLFMLRNETK